MADNRIIVNQNVLRRQATSIKNVVDSFFTMNIGEPDRQTTITANVNSRSAYTLAQNNFSDFGEALHEAANNVLLTADYFTDLDVSTARGLEL